MKWDFSLAMPWEETGDGSVSPFSPGDRRHRTVPCLLILHDPSPFSPARKRFRGPLWQAAWSERMKAIVFLADGFEECEALIVVDILRRARIETVMASVTGRPEVDSSRHILVRADALAEEVDYAGADLVVLPGGRLGTENLAKSEIVRRECLAFSRDRLVSAICAAPSILASLGLLDGRRATCHPDFEGSMPGAVLTGESVTVDGNMITGQGLGAAFPFAFELVRILAGEEQVRKIKKAICI